MAYEPLMYMHAMNGDLIKGPIERNDMLSPKAKASITRNLCRHLRPQMYLAMRDHLQRLGVPVRHGMESESYFENDRRAGVILKDGSHHEADLVIAADGVHGRSWKLVLGNEVLAQPSGDAIFRVSYPADVGLKDPVIASAFSLSPEGRPEVHIYPA